MLCLGAAALVLILILKIESHLEWQREKEGLPNDSLLQTLHCKWAFRPYGLNFFPSSGWKKGWERFLYMFQIGRIQTLHSKIKIKVGHKLLWYSDKIMLELGGGGGEERREREEGKKERTGGKS